MINNQSESPQSSQKEVKIRVTPATRNLINALCNDRNHTQAEVIDAAIRQMIAQPSLVGASTQIEAATQALTKAADSIERTLNPNNLLTPKALAGRPLVKTGNGHLMVEEDGRVFYCRNFKKPQYVVTIN